MGRRRARDATAAATGGERGSARVRPPSTKKRGGRRVSTKVSVDDGKSSPSLTRREMELTHLGRAGRTLAGWPVWCERQSDRVGSEASSRSRPQFRHRSATRPSPSRFVPPRPACLPPTTPSPLPFHPHPDPQLNHTPCPPSSRPPSVPPRRPPLPPPAYSLPVRPASSSQPHAQPISLVGV